MNCKPGDLAVIVANSLSVSGGYCGKVVRVTVLRRNQHGEPAWDYQGPRIFDQVCVRIARQLGQNDSEAMLQVLPDAILRPFRPDGITDDEVRELYEPQELVTVDTPLRAFARPRGFSAMGNARPESAGA